MLQIPAEIRLIIYEYIVNDLPWCTERYKIIDLHNDEKQPALAGICRKVRSELLPFSYDSVSLMLPPPNWSWYKKVERWQYPIGRHNLRHLKKVSTRVRWTAPSDVWYIGTRFHSFDFEMRLGAQTLVVLCKVSIRPESDTNKSTLHEAVRASIIGQV